MQTADLEWTKTCNSYSLLCVIRDEVDAKKKRASDPMSAMNSYVDQSVKVHKLKHGSTDEERVSGAFSANCSTLFF